LISGVPPAVLFAVDATVNETGKGEYEVVVKKAAIFSNFPSLKKKLLAIPAKSNIAVNFKDCVFVDHTAMERLHQFEMEYNAAGRHFHIIGLDQHRPNSTHPLAARKAFKKAA